MGIALLDACPRFHFLGSGVFFCCCYFNPHPHLTPINLSNLMVDLLVVCSKSTFVPSLERILVARQCQNSVNKQTSTALIQLIGAHRHLSLPLLLCRLTRRKDEDLHISLSVSGVKVVPSHQSWLCGASFAIIRPEDETPRICLSSSITAFTSCLSYPQRVTSTHPRAKCKGMFWNTCHKYCD